MKKIFLFAIILALTAVSVMTSSALASCYLDSLELHKSVIQKAENKVTDSHKTVSLWSPAYHFLPVDGWSGLFSGLSYFNGGYNLFYFNNPFAITDSKKYLGHSLSNDLLRWARLPISLAAVDTYDSGDLGAGSAIEKDGLFYLFYSGLQKDVNLTQKTVNLALSKDGVSFIKHANNPIISPPKGDFSQSKFDSPYIWMHDNRFYLLIASANKSGTESKLLLYRSKNLLDWELFNVIENPESESRIWEYPSYIEMKGFSGILLSYKDSQNSKNSQSVSYRCGIIPGTIDYSSGKFTQKGDFQFIDYGFDYYAPQISKIDENKYLVWGHLMDYQNNPNGDFITGAMPRILSYSDNKDNKIIVNPIPQFTSLRESKLSFKNFNVSHPAILKGFVGDAYEIETLIDLRLAKNFSLKLRTSDDEETVLFYDKVKQLFILNREKSGILLDGSRGVNMPLNNNCIKLHVFVDKSSIEVFINDGEAVLSSRIFPSEKSRNLKVSALGRAKVKYFNFYKLNIVQ